MQALVGIIMGSRSDWETMTHAAETLTKLGVAHEVRVISAHRTPDLLFEYASSAESRGLEVIIAAAGGAAHLAGVTAAKTVLGGKHPQFRQAVRQFREQQTQAALQAPDPRTPISKPT